MRKRGQVTVFIIVGILILAAIAIILFLKSSLVEEAVEVEAEKVQDASMLSASVKSYIRSCLEQTSNDALHFVSKQGGYYELPELSDDIFLMPYYFYDSEIEFLSKEELEEELAKYMDQNLFFCIRNFAAFEQQGYEIDQKDVVTSVSVNPENVLFDVKFPVKIKKGETAASLEQFSVKVSSRLGKMHGLIDKFLLEDGEDASSMCISCIVNLALMDNFRVEMNPVGDEDIIMFTLVDEQVLIKEEPYRFSFLNRYEFEPMESLLDESLLEFEE